MITEVPDGAHLDSDSAFSEKQPVAWGGGLARAAGAAQHRKQLLVHLLGPVQCICTTCERDRVLRGPVMAECSQQAGRLLTWCTREGARGHGAELQHPPRDMSEVAAHAKCWTPCLDRLWLLIGS